MDPSLRSATALFLERALTALGFHTEFLPASSVAYKATFSQEEGSCDLILAWIPSPSKTTEATGGDGAPSTKTAPGTSKEMNANTMEHAPIAFEKERKENRSDAPDVGKYGQEELRVRLQKAVAVLPWFRARDLDQWLRQQGI